MVVSCLSGLRKVGATLTRAVLVIAAAAAAHTASAAVSFIQGNSAVPQTPQTTVSATYRGAQTPGNLNVVAIGWYNTTAHVIAVTDAAGNTYTLAAGPTTQAEAGTQAIYYAPNIAGAVASGNHVTVTFDAAVPFPDLRIAEYSGIATTNPVDAAASATGVGTVSGAAVKTTAATDLLVAANYVTTATTGPGSGYASRLLTSPDGDILQDGVGTAAGTYFTSAPLAPSGAWIMQLVAFRAAVSSTQPPPSAPAGLAAAGATNGIKLSWTPSSGTVTQYLIERCQGTGCTSFAQIAATAANGYTDPAVTSGTSYSYRVRAQGATASLVSGYSNIATATTQSSGTVTSAIAFVQRNAATPQSLQSAVSATYAAAQNAGDLNVVVVGWNDSVAQVRSVTDTRGNTYQLAVGPTVSSGNLTQAIYYAANVGASSAGANVVTVTFDRPAAYVDLRIAAYRGVATTNPLDVVSTGVGISANSATSSVSTANANDLIVAANTVATGTTGAGAGYVSRVVTSPDSDILEDRVVTASGSYAATAPLSSSGAWVMQLVAFRAASSGGIASSSGTSPTISGTPGTSVQVGQTYNFQPTASAGGGTVSFSIQNKPAWASFSIATGALTGAPTAANVGTYAGIIISVSNGTASAALPSFTITVQPSSTSTPPPTIAGTPTTSVKVGAAYSFVPTASDPNGYSVTFSVANLPSWASFNTSTGQISGTPGAANVGTYSNIVITVSDGKASASLAPFSITVTQLAMGTATVTWTPPTTNSDGTALTNLAGYHIYYGTSSGALTSVITVSNPGTASYVVSNLSPGTYYFAVKSYTSAGVESSSSNVASKTIQ